MIYDSLCKYQCKIDAVKRKFIRLDFFFTFERLMSFGASFFNDFCKISTWVSTIEMNFKLSKKTSVIKKQVDGDN